MSLFRRRALFLMALSKIRDVVVSGVPPLTLAGATSNPISSLIAFGGTYQGVPTGYTLYNYITNASNTRIDTGIVDDVDDMEYEIRLSEATTAAWYIFSMRDSNTSVQYGISGSGSGSTITFTFSNVTLTSAITRTANHEYYIKGVHRDGKASLYVEDITAGTSDTQTATYNSFAGGTTPNIGVFGNGSNTVAGGNSVVSCRIVKSGKTVLDCVAAVKDANTRGLYDRISKTLLTATTGSVTAGAIRLPTPTAPIDIFCNNGVLKPRHQSGLPLGYTLLDFVESNGTQYIDTGIYWKYGYSLEMDMTSINNAGNSALFGASNGNSYNTGEVALFWNGAALECVYPTSVSTSVVSRINNIYYAATRYLIEYTNTALNVTTGGNTSTAVLDVYSSYVGTKTLALFATHRNSYAFPGAFKMHYTKIYDENGVLVRNFIPARRNSDSILGMYDTVSQTFFTNQGTGDFVAGNPVSDPVEIYTDGTQETINVHTKNLFNKSTIIGNRYISSNGAITSDGTNKTAVSSEIYVKPSTIYTLSGVGDIYTASYSRSGYQYQADGTPISAITATDSTHPTVTFTTATNCAYIIIMSCTPNVDTAMIEQNNQATAYEPYYDGGTATCEDLLSVGTYTDEQEIISGTVTHKVGVNVFDGTENWNWGVPLTGMFCNQSIAEPTTDRTVLCNQFRTQSTVPSSRDGYCVKSSGGNIGIGYDALNGDVNAFKAYLAQQYANGTPVIVIYPLATATTGSVTGQSMSTVEGDNICDITQASMSGLELSVTYKKKG